MKQFISTLCLMLLMVGATIAQRSVGGTVSGSDGGALIGASVRVKGTTRGTVTDLNGRYTVQVPDGANTLVFSYTGFNTQEVVLGASNAVDVTLAEGNVLDETVVTAFGSKRNKSDVVYANQTVSSDDLNTVTNRSALNALQGKVAGVKIGQASGAVGASTRVVLRGETSLTQGNNALIVIDGVPVNNSNASGGGGTGKTGDRDNYVDFGNRANDINPDDIESVTVLKGPSATTLYGSRGGSGVILVTTKKGRKSDKANISISSSYSNETPYLLYKNQEQYGSGYASCGGCAGSTQFFMGENFAWGPKFDGRVLPWTSQPFDANGLIPLSNGKFEQLERPYSAVPNNLANFFEVGSTLRNSVSIDGGTDKYSYFLSYTNFNNQGTVLNTNLNKHNIQLNVGAQFSPKLRSDFRINYAKSNQRGATEGSYPFGYSAGTPAMSFLTQTPANIPFNELRDWNSPYHDFKGFYGQYSINPYYILDNQDVRNSVDNVLSSVSMTYSPISNLSFTGKVSTNFFISTVTEKGPKFQYERAYSWSDGDLSDGGRSPLTAFNLGSYKESADRRTDLILDAYGTYTKAFGSDFKLTSMLGLNSIDQATRLVAGTTVGGLVVPGFYDFSNSAQNPLASNSATKYRLWGAYLNNSLGYKDYLFLEYSARQDYSSTLPQGNRGFFYQGGGFSYVPTNLQSVSLGPISSLKLRGGLGSAGKDAPQYRLDTYYGFNPTLLNLGDDFQIRFPLNDIPGAQKSQFIGNPNLKPELSITSEVGFDVGFWKNRLEVEYTYYNINSKNQIVDVNIPWSSGYGVAPTNIGRMVNKGHELALRMTPVRTQNVKWSMFGSWSKNINKVVEINDPNVLGEELNVYSGLVQFSGRGSMNLVAAEGQPFGTFKGTNFSYNSTGQLIVDAQGNPLQTDTLAYLGSYQPDFLASLGTEFSYKRFTFNALLDGRKGGLFFSGTKVSTEFNGTAVTTLLNDRRDFVIENSVNADGSANTTTTDAYHYFGSLPAAAYLLDGSYLKLRELSVRYSVPVPANSAFKSLSVGVFAKNAMFWVAKENTFADPEVGGVGGSSDAVGIESTTTPPSKSYGVELRVNF
jgi:TonB-linked SusC/RagA family outer membrane protein